MRYTRETRLIGDSRPRTFYVTNGYAISKHPTRGYAPYRCVPHPVDRSHPRGEQLIRLRAGRVRTLAAAKQIISDDAAKRARV